MEFIVKRQDDELQHHGILGQKWGVRRFQNEDGSLTSAGRKRYNIVNKAAKYAERETKYWQNSAKSAKKDIEEYKSKYSNSKYAKKDLEYMYYDMRSMKELANEWLAKQQKFMNMSIDQISSKDYREAKKFAKQYDKEYA